MAKQHAIDAMMGLIRNDLAELGIYHDIFTSEKSLHDAGMIRQVLGGLEQNGLIYKGVLEPPKGRLPDDWEEREQTLFRTTDYGDDSDRALVKSDGSWTYFAADVAYARHKLDRGFGTQLLVLGADHGGYVARMKAAVAALSEGSGQLEILLCQLVKLLDKGEPVKMSKRAGTFTTVRNVTDAVGKDVLRFIMLTRKSTEPLDFDLSKVTEQSKDNPVFYVQYAHARCRSLLRMAQEEIPEVLPMLEAPGSTLLAALQSPEELNLIRSSVNGHGWWNLRHRLTNRTALPIICRSLLLSSMVSGIWEMIIYRFALFSKML